VRGHLSEIHRTIDHAAILIHLRGDVMTHPATPTAAYPGSTRPIILPLAALDAGMLNAVGGKAANLGELISAGFPVPGGFCVTTEAYRRIADTADLAALLSTADHLGPDDAAGWSALAAKARETILRTPIPAGIERAILDAYQELGGDQQAVAVRSSATAEDLPFASFAGQQDTYLGVLGGRQVINAVRHCWASLWTERATVYRASQGIDQQTTLLAVVVQSMVPSEVAGVLFTANPVTGRRREAVIDASPGLGEAVVSGAVTPDQLIVDTASGRVLQSRVGDKQFAIRALPGGGTEQVSGPDGGLCLTKAQATQLASIGDRVERHFKAPQDIEWAFDGEGKLWLTQSRPITTLFPLPSFPVAQTAARPGLRVYFCFSVAQGLYRPITPMGLAAFRVLTSGGARLFGLPPPADIEDGPALYVQAGQRLFFDLTGVVRSRVGRAVMPRVFDLMEARSATVMRGLFDRPEFSVKHHSPVPAIRRVLRIGVRFRIPVYAAQALISPAAAHRRLARIEDDLQARLAVSGDASPEQRLQHAVDVLFTQSVPLAPKVLPAALAGLAMFGLATRLWRGIAEPGELQGVLRGIPHNVTTEMDLQLWHLTQRIRADGSATEALQSRPPADVADRYLAGDLPATLQDGLAEFLRRYGHRTVAEIDVGVARWSEDPTHILGVLANYLRLTDPAQAPDAVFARGNREATELIGTLATRAGQRQRWRGPVVRFALDRTRQLAGIREMPKNLIILTIGAARRDLVAVGAVLAGQGRIDRSDDVFFLTFAEARSGLAGRALQPVVAQRRQDYQHDLRRRRAPRVLLSDGTDPENVGRPAEAVDGGLRGVAASPGTVIGPARVILDPVGAHLEPGDILVAPSTDPGWTPLFLTAGGLVMEMGGANSHGAVVAREYGIPAVVGVPLATERISSGDPLIVNGTLGTVAVGTTTAG
jgi:pyruvate,water dikinase